MARNNEFIEEIKGKKGISFRVHIPYFDSESNKRTFFSQSFSVSKYGTRARALEYAKKCRDENKLRIQNDSIYKEKNFTLDEVFSKAMEVNNCSLENKDKLNCLYRKYIQNMINGNRVFKTIRCNDILESLNKMTTIASDDTIRRVSSIWRKLYKYAINSEVVFRNEFSKIENDIPKSEMISKPREISISKEEVIELIEELPYRLESNRDKLLFTSAMWIGFHCGLRPSEIFALAKSNIDRINRKIRICQSVGSTSEKKNTIKKTKTNSSIRDVFYNEELDSIIESLFSNTENDLLFIRDNGQLLNSEVFSHKLYEVSNGRFRLYQLRHLFATDNVINGVDMRTTQELMGHTSSSMTLSYARSNDNLKEKAVSNRKLYN